MRWIVILAICVAITGCGAAKQPASARTVAAFEVPLPSEADRNQFLSVLRAAAAAEGMHVDAASTEELESEVKVSPAFKMTMNATVWRGANDAEAIASAMDHPDHLGQVWIAFFRGEDPTLSSKLRESAMREIMRQWPGTLSLPIMPTGAIPLHRDLVRTPNGYIVNPSEAHKYGLAATERRPVLASGIATGDIVVVPADQDTYKISVPTDKIPPTMVTIPATKDMPAQIMRVPDLGAAETRAEQVAREYCAKTNKSMVFTGGGFDMGPGLTLIFRCVPPA